MISNIQDNHTEQKLSIKRNNLFPLSLLTTSKISLAPATASGKNHQLPPDLLADSDIQQLNNTKNSLRGLFPHFLLAGLALSLFSGNLFAANANLAWDASTSSSVGGYKVSYGQSSGTYASTVDVGNTTKFAVTGLQEGSKYFFAVKAYDSARTTESAYSNETNYTVPVTVSTALKADFTPASPINVVQGSSVTFTDITTGTVTSRTWNLPGSNATNFTSTAQAVTVSYPTANTATNPTYSVSLTVTGSSGTPVTTTKQITVMAANTLTTGTTGSTGTTGTTTTVKEDNNVGLVAAYGFEETSGKTVADASGNGNHGSIKEAVRIANGRFGKALKFDGVNDWVTVNNSASLALSSGMTLEAWVYPQSLAGWNNVILKEESGGLRYGLYANSDTNGPSSYINNGSDRDASEPTQLALNQWTHLVGTYDGQVQRLYVNGIEVANSAQNGLIQQSSGVLSIGGNSVWGEYFKGYIDEVRIYNRALSATEVSNNLATAISASNPPQFVMGDKTLEPWVDYRKQGVAEAFQTVPKKSSVVTAVQVYLDASSTATALVAGIYKNNNGHPGALVAKGTLSAPKTGAWNPVPIPLASVTAGQPYWIAILGSKGQIGFLDNVVSGTGLMETSASSSLTSLPSTWTGSVTKANAALSVYGNGY